MLPRKPELEEVSQIELICIAELDEYIEILQWWRNRKANRIAQRIAAGADVEHGPRRPLVRNGRLEVR